MFKKTSVLIFTVTSLFSTIAFAQDRAGNGGDAYESVFKNVASNIEAWIESGNADAIKLPATMSLVTYKTKMLAALKNYQISFTEDKVFVHGYEKTCKNDVDSSNENQILCNSQKFGQAYKDDIDLTYQLVHHEFAGLAGLEVNNAQDSDYTISTQISDYLQDEIMKRLPVTSTQPAPLNQDPSVQGICKNAVMINLAAQIQIRFCEIPAASNVQIGNLHPTGESLNGFDATPGAPRNFRMFQMGETTVTQLQYKTLTGAEPWKKDGQLQSHVAEGDDFPATYIDWQSANHFIDLMNKKDPTATYRLPTEAEWEYAARSGTTTKYYWGDSSNDNFDADYDYSASNSGFTFISATWNGTVDAHPMQATQCPSSVIPRIGYCTNGFGLYHMLGNVVQWTADFATDDYKNVSTDGDQIVPVDLRLTSPEEIFFILRGSSWADGLEGPSSEQYVFYRGLQAQTLGNEYDGFRIVRIPKTK